MDKAFNDAAQQIDGLEKLFGGIVNRRRSNTLFSAASATPLAIDSVDSDAPNRVSAGFALEV